MTRVTDIIARYVKAQGVDHIFTVTGGGSIYLTDGIYPAGLEVVCCHHEQAAAIAAEAYARLRGLGVCYVTTGCGGTNSLTGVLGAYQDSIPLLMVGGQVKRVDSMRLTGAPVRQLGVQEADIIPMVAPITKYATTIHDPESIAYELEKAVWLARHGRPGPVWLDVPLDVQKIEVDEATLRHYEPPTGYARPIPPDALQHLASMLDAAQKPVIVVGGGVHGSATRSEFARFAERLNVPVVATRGGIDVMPTDHPLMIGRIGIRGDVAGNLAVKEADLILSIGSRLSTASVGYDRAGFAPHAKIAVVDVDAAEHRKPGERVDLFIMADAMEFLCQLGWWREVRDDSAWVATCCAWRDANPVSPKTDALTPYALIDKLNKLSADDSVFVADAGSAHFVTAQAIRIRGHQELVMSDAQSVMGYTLPAAVGASVARARERVFGITGDGSLQMNLQELQTVVHHNLPVKLFVLNNRGYRTIRGTQEALCGSRYIGTGECTGISMPSTAKLADAYGIPYWRVATVPQLDAALPEVIKQSGPSICELILEPNHYVLKAAL